MINTICGEYRFEWNILCTESNNDVWSFTGFLGRWYVQQLIIHVCLTPITETSVDMPFTDNPGGK